MSKFNQLIQQVKKIYHHDYKIDDGYLNYSNDTNWYDFNNLTFQHIDNKIFLKQFYNKSYICQAPSDEATYGESIYTKILNCSSNTFLAKNEIINLFDKDWILLKEFESGKNLNLVIYKFDFQNCETQQFSLIQEMSKYYNGQSLNYYLKNRNLHKKDFSQLTQLSNGLLKVAENNCLLLLNTNKELSYTRYTINHELFHYIQQVTGKFLKSTNLKPSEITNNQINNYLIKLLLPKIYYQEYFLENEFWTYIHVNLINFLEEFIYRVNNIKKIDSKTLINSLIQNIVTYKEQSLIKSAYIKKIFKIMSDKQTNMIKFLILIYLLYPNSLWKDILILLTKKFN